MSKQVPLYQIVVRENYRQEYDQQFVNDTAADMAANGFKEEFPMSVYQDGDQFVVITGHTRHKSAELGSSYDIKTHQPTMLVWVVVKDKPTDANFKLEQLSENEARRDPDDISKAIGYKQALDAGATITQIAQSTSRTPDYIQRRVDLLPLLPEIQQLVATKNMGITFALSMKGLDANFQHIALTAFRDMKSPTFDEFHAVCSNLLEKQNTCSLFDLSLFNGQPIKEFMDAIKVERPKTRAELEAELKAAIEARRQDRIKATAVLAAQKAEIERLNGLLSKAA